MRLRFRIRTLMLVVAGIACVSAVLVQVPETGYLLIPAIGPLIGATWVARRYEPGRVDPITGGVAGGAVQTALVLVTFFCYVPFMDNPMRLPSTFVWLCILVSSPFWLGVHGIYGVMVGLFFSWCLAVSPLFGRASGKPGRRIADRGLRPLRPAEDAFEFEDPPDSFHEVAVHLHLTEEELSRAIHSPACSLQPVTTPARPLPPTIPGRPANRKTGNRPGTSRA